MFKFQNYDNVRERKVKKTTNLFQLSVAQKLPNLIISVANSKFQKILKIIFEFRSKLSNFFE